MKTMEHLSFENPVFSRCLKLHCKMKVVFRNFSEFRLLSVLSLGDPTLHHGEFLYEFLVKS